MDYHRSSRSTGEQELELVNFESRLDANIYEEKPVFFKDGRRRIDFVITYDSSKTEHDELRATFREQLISKGIELEDESLAQDEDLPTGEKGESIAFIKLHATWNVLCKWAEITRMRKAIAINNLANNSNEGNWKSPCTNIWRKIVSVPHPQKYNYKYNDHEHDESFFTAPFDMARIEKFHIRDEENFFTAAERQRIVLNILNRTSFGDTTMHVGISRLVDKGCYKSYFPLHEGDWRPDHVLKSVSGRGGAELNKRQTLYWIWARPGVWHSGQPLELIRQYFGEKIGMYFAWLGYYTAMLVPVSILGLLTCIYGLVFIRNDIVARETCNSDLVMCPTCDRFCPFANLSSSCTYATISRAFDNEITLIFALITSLWATVFLEFWKRKRAGLVHKWDLEDFEEEEDQIRPEYEGLCKKKKINPITGMDEPYLSLSTRLPRLIGSCSVFFVLIVLVVGAVFGVVVYRIIVAALLPSASTGVVQQNSNLITSTTASCLNFIVITLMNMLYEKIAEYMTNLEAPRTATDFEDSFTLKMFLFQAVNYYSSILYIAFFKGRFVGSPYKYNRIFGFRSEECDPSGCLIELCIQLGIIMILKQALNNIQEILIPMVMNWWSKRSLFKVGKDKKKTDDAEPEEDLYDNALYRDYVLEDPGKRYLFSEYLEMVIQFGFVTLFVASFPLAPFFALLNNIMEIRIDAYKFTTQIRRLPAIRAENIGGWFAILKAISTLAVITNGLVIAITSDFVPRLLYLYLYSDCSQDINSKDVDCLTGYVNATLVSIPVSQIDRGTLPPYDTSDPGIPEFCWFRASDPSLPTQPVIKYWHVLAGRIALLVVFEHAVFGLKLLIDLIIPDVPRELKQQMSRQKYLELKLLYDKDGNVATDKSHPNPDPPIVEDA